ncbi:hypothetical protein O1611_g4660 [Lasiodiplodia mahajangana]|uniref:Uncharacterized protein n=1 Tax=Lasiodiplodia mahajangana TaxID=1108764 RepID=A0ACC2JND8_9PEZI|nr:hypothetical protein O1611_g4660 [Lasiodiplodia mahajangana]
MRDSRHSSSLSAEYNNNFNNHYPPQGGQGNDPFQPLASQNRTGGGSFRGGYGAGGSPSMGNQMYGQYNPQQGQMGPGDGYRGYDSSRDHSYTQSGNQQSQADSRPYQQSNQQGQNWGTFGPGMSQGYQPAGPSQYGQEYQQGPQGQIPQGQQHQGQPQFGRGMQNQPIPGVDPSIQSQFSGGGLGGGPQGGGSVPGSLGN